MPDCSNLKQSHGKMWIWHSDKLTIKGKGIRWLLILTWKNDVNIKIDVFRKPEEDRECLRKLPLRLCCQSKWEGYCRTLNTVSLENQTLGSFFIHYKNTIFEIMNVFPVLFGFHDKSPNRNSLLQSPPHTANFGFLREVASLRVSCFWCHLSPWAQ